MSLIKTAGEIQKLAAGGQLLAKILRAVVAKVAPGVTGLELNELAEKLMVEAGGEVAFKNYGQPPYPYGLCVSINDCVVHGIATDKPLQEGDIVSLDIGLKYQGLYTDMAVTVPVGKISKEAAKLIRVTEESLNKAIAVVKPGVTLGELGYTVQRHVEQNGFGVVRDFVGHGVGHEVHEEPQIPNFGQPGQGMELKEGMVICIEPMVTLGEWDVKVLDNGWDAVTVDGSLAAHFEHTIVVTKEGHKVLTK